MADAAERWTRIQTLFEQAQNRPPDEQTAWLRSVCGDDREVYDHVSAMLDGAQHEHGLFGGRAIDLVEDANELVTDALAPSRVGDRVGPWVLGERIGVGGMGAVYRAERADAPGGFEQTAALKSIKRGMDSEAVLARFRAERQILARLEHPGIARLLDGGLDADGRPYFAMELVEGEPITDYADARQLDVRARLELFARVCDAVAYAHRQLVVHRDLKPSNVLVGEPDEESGARVKLLDFGIARVLSDDDGGDLTQTGQRVFTPGYAAPEQIRGEAPTTSTDVYALGVLLYRLLAGARPIETEGRSTFEVERAVLDEAPARPSVAVTPDAARARNAAADELAKALRGDLDVICLKALDKDPDRRYGSAAELGADVRRQLDGLPIEARPATASYRAAKFARRHRAGVLGTAAALVALVILTGAYTVRLAAERDRAEAENQTAEAVTSFVSSLFSAADALLPGSGDARDVRAIDLLEQGAERAEAELADQPEVQTRLRLVLGEAFLSLGDYDRASDVFEAAYARRDEVPPMLRVEATHTLGGLRWESGEYDEAERLQREALAQVRRIAEPGAVEPGFVANDLGLTLQAQGAHEESLPLLHEALATFRQHYGHDHPFVDIALQNVASVQYALGDADAYEEALREIMDRQRKRGPLNARAANTIGMLGNFLIEERGDPEAGEPLLRESLGVRRRILGEDHPYVAVSLNELAGARLATGDVDAATDLFERALALRRRVLDEGHPHIAYSLVGLGRAYMEAGRTSGAEPLFREAIQIREAALPDDHELIFEARSHLGASLAARGAPEGNGLLRQSYESLLASRGPDARQTREARERLDAFGR